MSWAIAGLTIALGICVNILVAMLIQRQRQRYAREHQQHLRRMAHLRKLANPPTDARRDRVGYM